MLDISSWIGGFKNRNLLRKSSKVIRKIEKFERAFTDFTDSDFKRKTEEFKSRVSNGETLKNILPEAFALVRCASAHILNKPITVCGQDQVWDMVHYNVQLAAGIALANRMVAEIATGEGKTLIATLPAYAYALFGKGCHIATVNEYLARRDCEWMRPLYSVLGLSCAYVYSGQKPEDKKDAYAADITYGTSSEFGFDYLRDNSMTYSPEEKVQRGYFYCLVDEADSILVDEARTPLIISGSEEETQENPYKAIIGTVQALVGEQNNFCNGIVRGVFDRLKSGAQPQKSDIEKLVQVKNGAPRNRVLKQILQMGVVNVAFEKMQTELTTSLGMGLLHKLQDELFYCVDEKNNSVSLTLKGQNYLSPKNPDAFTLPDVQAETDLINSDAALCASEKNARIQAAYSRNAEVSARLHLISQLLRAYSLYERDVDYIVREGKVEIIDPNTGRVMGGRRWSDGLHQAIEAKERLKVEPENITYATVSIQNYFRMYKHLAGMSGTAKELADEFQETYGMGVIEIPPNKPCVRKDNPDIFFLTRKEKYGAIIALIKKICANGRPVLVGTGSVEDSELLSRALKISHIQHNLLNAKNDLHEAQTVASAGQPGQITIATNMAGRGTDIKLGKGVNELGGLFIISSEHHYSRRIDRQLMGRCARQGDNGETLFVISLEDEILRKHADVSPFQKAIKSKYREGVPMSHPLFERIVARTQDKIETDYSGARKSMLKFDNPSNKQRAIAYGLRDEIISAQSPDELCKKMMSEFINERIFEILPSEDMDITADDIEVLNASFRNALTADCGAFKLSEMRKKEIAERVLNGAWQSFENTFAQFDENFAPNLKKIILLRSFDTAWREHISRLEDLRNAIFLRGYAQKDPYCEFEKEAFDSFEDFLRDWRESFFCSVKGKVAALVPSAISRPAYRNITR